MDHITAFHLALTLVKQAGFELKYAARNSETCYYYHPARGDALLRVSTHKSKNAPIGLAPPIAKATFSPKDQYLSEKRVHDMVRWAVGCYFVNPPRSSQYDGPKQWRTLTDGVSVHEPQVL